MIVSELIEQLKKMPQHINVYQKDGKGITSAKLIHRYNLLESTDLEHVEQFCEIINYFEEHTEVEDMRIERDTGFKTKEELIAAYLELKKEKDNASD